MKTITVNTEKAYPVIIGENILKDIGKISLPLHPACKAAVITDCNVFSLYGSAVISSLKDAGYDACHYAFLAGENSKNINIYIEILDFLTEHQLTRTDMIVALGGGVVGDMAGFVAATYLRGIPYIQIPTSLLAMVDSSVGGKTAIDLPAGKNLIGAFYQPLCVICDHSLLHSLPCDTFRDGCAEIVKYAILYDPELFRHLQTNGLNFDREYVISRCVELKSNVVSADEFDAGARQKLNLGHTLGHSIEALSNFNVTHGKAVASGIAITTRAAHQCGICDANTSQAIIDLLRTFGFSVHTEYSDRQLFDSALSDKKRTGSNINLVLPVEIGNCTILPTPITELQSFIKAGL